VIGAVVVVLALLVGEAVAVAVPEDGLTVDVVVGVVVVVVVVEEVDGLEEVEEVEELEEIEELEDVSAASPPPWLRPHALATRARPIAVTTSVPALPCTSSPVSASCRACLPSPLQTREAPPRLHVERRTACRPARGATRQGRPPRMPGGYGSRAVGGPV
jgi:hypothetical protein